MLRDLPPALLNAARRAAARLAGAIRAADPPVALAASAQGVAAVTAGHVLVAGDAAVDRHAAGEVDVEDDRLLASGREVAAGLVESRRGRLAAALELVRAAGAAPRPPASHAEPQQGDPVELLRRLGELRDSGVIEAAEFEAKKAELLRRI
jgi:hypothetical protein